jgi:hypothetical protein
VKRRDFIKVIAGSVAAWPLATRAQARRPLVGYLAGAAPASVMRSTTALAFVNGLREQGYVEGHRARPSGRARPGSTAAMTPMSKDALHGRFGGKPENIRSF